MPLSSRLLPTPKQQHPLCRPRATPNPPPNPPPAHGPTSCLSWNSDMSSLMKPCERKAAQHGGSPRMRSNFGHLWMGRVCVRSALTPKLPMGNPSTESSSTHSAQRRPQTGGRGVPAAHSPSSTGERSFTFFTSLWMYLAVCLASSVLPVANTSTRSVPHLGLLPSGDTTSGKGWNVFAASISCEMAATKTRGVFRCVHTPHPDPHGASTDTTQLSDALLSHLSTHS